MKSNRVGASEVFVTEIGLGTAQLGDLYARLDQDRADAIVDAAWDAGIRYFDTAPHYGVGLAERRLGIALADRPREGYVISSKVGRLLVDDGSGGLTREWDFSADGVHRSIDESLHRLGLDRIDIALIHDPQGRLGVALDEAYPALAAMKAAGVVGAIGVGSGDLEALAAFATNTDVDALMVAGRLTLLEQPALDVIVPAARSRGMSILNAGVFNSGLLATDSPGETSPYEYAAPPSEVLERARRLATVAAEHGTSLPQAAVRYAASQPAVAALVVGADSAGQITETVRMALEERPLDELWAALASAGLIPS